MESQTQQPLSLIQQSTSTTTAGSLPSPIGLGPTKVPTSIAKPPVKQTWT